MIFNTVPAVILNEKCLNQIKNDALIIDLASKPGGVDFDTAGKLGLKVVWALSLPGKIAPVTSGEIIACTILNICLLYTSVKNCIYFCSEFKNQTIKLQQEEISQSWLVEYDKAMMLLNYPQDKIILEKADKMYD